MSLKIVNRLELYLSSQNTAFRELIDDADTENLSLDSTIMHIHQKAAGTKKHQKSIRESGHWFKSGQLDNENSCPRRWLR